MSSSVCSQCGAFGDIPHGWTEGTCPLPRHWNKDHGWSHQTRLLVGAFVCVPCVELWQDRLTEIVELWATLQQVQLAGSIPNDTPARYEKPRKAPASPSPLNLQAWALAHPELMKTHVWIDGVLEHVGRENGAVPFVEDLLAQWAEALYDHNGWGGEWPSTVSGACAALKTNIETIARMPDMDTFDAELDWIYADLRKAHGIGTARPVGRCPSLDGWGRECRGPLWPDPAGNMLVTCSRCRRSFGEQYLMHLGGMLNSNRNRENGGRERKRLHRSADGTGRA